MESNGEFTNLNSPGAVSTCAYSINDHGQVAGSYLDTSRSNSYAFVESNGVFTTLNPPGGVDAKLVVFNAVHINDSGQVAEVYVVANVNVDSFVATPANATTPIPSAIWLVLTALAGLMGLGRRHVCIKS